MCPHEIGEIKMCVRLAHKQWPSLVHSGHRLSREIVVCQKSAAVLVTLQRLIVKLSEKLVHIDIDSEVLRKLPEQTDPGVQIRGTVVAVHHRHGIAGRCGHHIQFLVYRL